MLYLLLFALAFSSESNFEPLQVGKTPAQWKSRIIYQVLTDRFERTDSRNASCTLNQYCGGTYKGIMKHLDYIKNLGMNAIWISPIVENYPGSYHGYHATNFYALNTNFGTESELRQFIAACQAKDIWVMVDLVFNHVGPVGTTYTGINPFNKAEHYHDYCDITDYSNQTNVENCRIAGLPDLKQENTWVRDELIAWANWIVKTYNLDGLRIDTVKHVPTTFWKAYMNGMPNIYMVGEVFDGNPSYLSTYTKIMPGQLSYPMYYTLKSVYGDKQSCYQLRNRFSDYDNLAIDTTLLCGFVDNHDNNRWLNQYRDWASLKNALAFNLLSASIPLVYYGTEQGYTGGADPNNREPLWYSGFNQNHELYKFIQVAANARKNIPVSAEHIERYVDDVFYAFSRGETLVCTTNQGSNMSSFTRQVTYLPFTSGTKVKELYSGQSQTVSSSGLKITMSKGMPQIWVKA